MQLAFFINRFRVSDFVGRSVATRFLPFMVLIGFILKASIFFASFAERPIADSPISKNQELIKSPLSSTDKNTIAFANGEVKFENEEDDHIQEKPLFPLYCILFAPPVILGELTSYTVRPIINKSIPLFIILRKLII